MINPKSRKSQAQDIMPPLGLVSIGCVLQRNGFSVKILDLEIKNNDFDLAAYIKNSSPKIVGISGMSHSRFESFRIAGIVKKASNNISTVYGGCHATFTAEDTLSHIKEIDYIVRGEGEATMLELVKFLAAAKGIVNDIAGISFRKHGKIIQNAPRQRISNLDSIPYSKHLLEMEKYLVCYNAKYSFLTVPKPAIYLMTSRGCSYNCSFCSESAMFGRIYTMRSAKNVVDEIENYIEDFNIIKGIKFYDSTLTLNRKHVLELTKELNSRNINLPWECEIRVNTVDKTLLGEMKKSGCSYVNFGVESASERVLERIGKGITLEQTSDVLKWCKELGIKTKLFFSFGHIGETWDDSKKTFAFINDQMNYITTLTASVGVKIFPGTEMEHYATNNGLMPKYFSWSDPLDGIPEGSMITDNIPILLQPFYGIKELKKCNNRLYRIELKRELKGARIIMDKIKKIKSFSDLCRKISRLFN